MEAFTLATCGAIYRATCVEECAQCVRDVPLILKGTVHTQTHANAHLNTQCDVTARTKYR